MRLMLIEAPRAICGSMDGASPAAPCVHPKRASGARLGACWSDIDKPTVPFQPNYDGAGAASPRSLRPVPSGNLRSPPGGNRRRHATNIPPHISGEWWHGCIAYIDNPRHRPSKT